jgi:hypothetical protein
MIHAEQASKQQGGNVRAERQQQQQNNERAKGAIICDAVHLEQ